MAVVAHPLVEAVAAGPQRRVETVALEVGHHVEEDQHPGVLPAVAWAEEASNEVPARGKWAESIPRE